MSSAPRLGPCDEYRYAMVHNTCSWRTDGGRDQEHYGHLSVSVLSEPYASTWAPADKSGYRGNLSRGSGPRGQQSGYSFSSVGRNRAGENSCIISPSSRAGFVQAVPGCSEPCSSLRRHSSAFTARLWPQSSESSCAKQRSTFCALGFPVQRGGTRGVTSKRAWTSSAAQTSGSGLWKQLAKLERDRQTSEAKHVCMHLGVIYLVGAREVSERASAAESGIESKTGVSRPLEDGIGACACGHLRREYAALQELFHPMSPPNMRILAAHTSSRQTTLRPATVRWLRRSIVRGFGRASATLDMYSYACRIYSWASRRNERSAYPAAAVERPAKPVYCRPYLLSRSRRGSSVDVFGIRRILGTVVADTNGLVVA